MKKYKMDLHIHTPASKCYKGPKNDDEYFKIIDTACDQNLDIIAITDHNTLDGYERIIYLKNEIYKKIEFLEKYQNESQRMKEEYEEAISKKKSLESILILPGVEITLNPGIHILVIGNITDTKLLSQLLDEIGYTDDRRGSDNDNPIDTDIISFLKNPLLEKLIVSAPHIDSKNGIYNELSGHYRSAVMKNEIITSFSINSDNQKENIIRLFKTDPEYKRDKLPAIINCSDAHESNQVGNKYSYVELEASSYDELVKLFINPVNKISDTDDDRLEQLIIKMMERDNAFLLDKPNNDVTEISRLLCAILNENIPVVFIGVNDDLKLIGVNKEFEDYVEQAIKMISSTASSIEYSIKQYKLGNGKYVLILIIQQDEKHLWYQKIENKVYSLVDNRPAETSIEGIEEIVYNNALCDILEIEQSDEARLSKAIFQINSTKYKADKLFAIKQLSEGTFPILQYCDIDICESSRIDENQLDKIHQLGTAKGNTYYIFKNFVRLEDAILRTTCPTAFLPEDILDNVNVYDIKKNSIVIVRGGGTHYIPADGKIFGINEDFIVLTEKEEYDFDMKVLLAWMKSSLLLWYASRKIGSTDLYIPPVLTKLIFPIEKIANTDELVNIVDEIINLEYKFLNQYEKKIINNISENDVEISDIESKMILDHNNLISEKVCEIDRCFFENLGIELENADWISADFAADGIFDSLISEN